MSHEAGHAVAARLVRMRFGLVTIMPGSNGPWLGELVPGRNYADDGAADRRTIERANAQIFVHIGVKAEGRSGERSRLDVFDEHRWNGLPRRIGALEASARCLSWVRGNTGLAMERRTVG